MPVLPDVEIKSRPSFSKSYPIRSYGSFYYLQYDAFYFTVPKSNHNFWLLFKGNLSPKTFKKSPNLVTLVVANNVYSIGSLAADEVELGGQRLREHRPVVDPLLALNELLHLPI